jgi:mannose-1-phosphate guanylyltransferase
VIDTSMEHTYCVIMAGGKGERFWPLSTRRVPKPFVKLIGNRSMIQMTVDRALRLAPPDRVFIVLGEEHAITAREQLPELGRDQFIIEPTGRDTAPCIGFAAILLHLRNPEAVMVVLPADHYVPDARLFAETISVAVACARKGDHLVTTGIWPTRPETGYGYIHAVDKAADVHELCYRINRFVEKPDEAKAARYLSEGGYYWNSGIFVWRVATVLKAMERHMPELRTGLGSIEEALRAENVGRVDELFGELQRISIDYGLMEKADNVLMVKAAFAWDDVGTWSSLRRTMALDENGNYISGRPVVCIDTTDCVIYGEDIRVGVVGVSNLVVVASKQGVLVCDLQRDQDTRQIARMFEGEDAEGAED